MTHDRVTSIGVVDKSQYCNLKNWKHFISVKSILDQTSVFHTTTTGKRFRHTACLFTYKKSKLSTPRRQNFLIG